MMNSFNLSAFTKANGNSNGPGQYAAICNRFVDCGTQTSNYLGKTTESRKIWLSWECHGAEGDGFTHNQFFTASVNSKSALRKLIDAWNGNPLTRDQWKTVDASWMLGRSGILTLDYANEVDDRMAIKTICPLPEDAKIPQQKYPSAFFSLGAPDLDVFAKLPSGVQEMIKKSPEWQTLPFADNWNAEQMKRPLAGLKELKADQPPF